MANGNEWVIPVIALAEFLFQIGKEPNLNGLPEFAKFGQSVPVGLLSYWR